MKFDKLQNEVNEFGIECFHDFKSCCEHGWYDWFCSDRSLKSRTKAFIPIIKGVKNGGKVDMSWDVWFKNNCPMVGNLYDDMRISSERGNEFVIAHNYSYVDAPWAIYTFEDDYQEPILFNNVRSVVKWLNEK